MTEYANFTDKHTPTPLPHDARHPTTTTLWDILGAYQRNGYDECVFTVRQELQRRVCHRETEII